MTVQIDPGDIPLDAAMRLQQFELLLNRPTELDSIHLAGAIFLWAISCSQLLWHQPTTGAR